MVTTRLQKNMKRKQEILYTNDENKIEPAYCLVVGSTYNTQSMPAKRQSPKNRDSMSPTNVTDVIKREDLRPDITDLTDNQNDESDDDSSVKNEQGYDSSVSNTSKSSNNDYIKRAQKRVTNIVPFVRPYITSIYQVSALYVFWIALHYITAQLYVKYCATPTFYGFLVSPFLISSPHCVAMRWVFTKGGNLIEGMWTLLGTWLCSKIITRN